MKKTILNKLCAALLSSCLTVTAIAPTYAENVPTSTATDSSGDNATGTKAITGEQSNAFAVPYNESWAQLGCTKDGWDKTNRAYNESMVHYRAQANVLDQRALNVIRNPNQMNVKGFEFLGCDLTSSLGSLKDIANEVQDLLGAISTGSIKDKIIQKLESMARNMLEKTIEKAQQQACQAVNNKISEKTKFITENYSEAKQILQYVDNFDKIVEQEENKAVEALSNAATGKQ